MKRMIISLLILCLALTFSGCSHSNEQNFSESKIIAGYIFIQDTELVVDEVEIITRDDKERIEELGLIESRDYPSGYYIYNPESNTVALELTDNTTYIFVDFQQLYKKDETGNRLYETKALEEFIKGSTYPEDMPLDKQRIPYFIEVTGKEVISITEEFMYTI